MEVCRGVVVRTQSLYLLSWRRRCPNFGAPAPDSGRSVGSEIGDQLKIGGVCSISGAPGLDLEHTLTPKNGKSLIARMEAFIGS